jgi:hypothetical protein
MEALLLLQIALIMQTNPLAMKLRQNICLNISPIYHQFRPAILQTALLYSLFHFPSRTEPVSQNIFTYLKPVLRL